MDQEVKDAAEVFPEEISFVQAKIEHYLRRCEEYMQTSRLLMAKKMMEKVFAIEPENRAARSLEKRIEYSLSSLSMLSREGRARMEEGGELSPKHRRGKIVLIVDQDEKVLGQLSDRLKLNGFDPVSAGSYREALDVLGLIRPNIVISEVNFENGPLGFDLYLWVRTNQATAGIPFVFLAMKIDRDTLIAGKKVGVDDFILKPLDADVVTASVIQCLSRKRGSPTEN